MRLHVIEGDAQHSGDQRLTVAPMPHRKICQVQHLRPGCEQHGEPREPLPIPDQKAAGRVCQNLGQPAGMVGQQRHRMFVNQPGNGRQIGGIGRAQHHPSAAANALR